MERIKFIHGEEPEMKRYNEALERKRVEALESRKSHEYFVLCKRHGLSFGDIEDEILYMAGEEVNKFDENGEGLEEKVNSSQEQGDDAGTRFLEVYRSSGVSLEFSEDVSRKRELMKQFKRFKPGERQDVSNYSAGQVCELFRSLVKSYQKRERKGT
jgi:hypothetical protein